MIISDGKILTTLLNFFGISVAKIKGFTVPSAAKFGGMFSIQPFLNIKSNTLKNSVVSSFYLNTLCFDMIYISKVPKFQK